MSTNFNRLKKFFMFDYLNPTYINIMSYSTFSYVLIKLLRVVASPFNVLCYFITDLGSEMNEF